MPGTVRVFNCYNEPLRAFAVGGFSGPGTGAWGNQGASMYQPQSVVFPRIKHADERTGAQFAYGDNPCVAQWDSFNGYVTIPIPSGGGSQVSLDDDLIVFLLTNQATLVTARGQAIGTFPVKASFQGSGGA